MISNPSYFYSLIFIIIVVLIIIIIMRKILLDHHHYSQYSSICFTFFNLGWVVTAFTGMNIDYNNNEIIIRIELAIVTLKETNQYYR